MPNQATSTKRHAGLKLALAALLIGSVVASWVALNITFECDPHDCADTGGRGAFLAGMLAAVVGFPPVTALILSASPPRGGSRDGQVVALLLLGCSALVLGLGAVISAWVLTDPDSDRDLFLPTVVIFGSLALGYGWWAYRIGRGIAGSAGN